MDKEKGLLIVLSGPSGVGRELERRYLKTQLLHISILYQ